MSACDIPDSLRIQSGVAPCEECGSTARVGRGFCLNCMLRRALGSETETTETLDQVLDEIEVRDADWRIGNYQILEEIGRGGMGVIYRARQRHSLRIVALKRILSFHADSRDTLARFRREAEAAASLDHPNILPIYEVSESDDGLPFFSMKFAAGGSLLDAARSLRNDPRRIIALMAKVTRAVQYAHSHGIIHRDLKPGNILLDGRGEPMVSDFGLARWLDASSDLTRTLTIFGTPGYIAPEQARGPAKNLTPAADIYSIGCILFDLFTGRTPFLGEHALAVIKQASEKPAPKLRTLTPRADRDVETICAKCLEREPQARFRSAGDLAEDFERWVEGRPIVARPVSPPVRIWRWSKRNPKLASSVAATAVLGMLLLAIAVPIGSSWFLTKPPAIPKKSIAVLPFENRSEEKDNAYFAEGIQDEILTRLSKIADLKVISRTSTQHYKSAPKNLPEIARQLGVAHILEGSVQKNGDAVRVNVQLINAVSDSHLWADTFDRKLTDLFLVESEVARAIADRLQAKLTGREEQALTARPTNNPDAYDAYLHALACEARNKYSNDLVRKTIDFYERSVQLDPNFALAWARLSRAHALFYFRAGDVTTARRNAAKEALEHAQNLQPSSPETLLALGYYQYWVLRDYGLAKKTIGLVNKVSPGRSEVQHALAAVARREGKWDESLAYFEQALVLDPRNTEILGDAAWTHAMLRQFPTALKLYDRALDIVPNEIALVAVKASIYQAQGHIKEAAKLLADIDPQTATESVFSTKITQLRLERNLGEALRVLQARQAEFQFGSVVDKGRDQILLLAIVQFLSGDTSGAKATAEQARKTLEPFYEKQPDNPNISVLLSVAQAFGEKDSALKEAERAIKLSPSGKDGVSEAALEENLALIYTLLGEHSRAISILTRLLQTPYASYLYYPLPITPALLRLDPLWDSLRGDAAFQKLCEEKQQ